MKYLKVIILLFSFHPLFADVGSFDIIEFTKDSESYYLRFWSMGNFINNDLIYYGWNGDNTKKASDLIFDFAERSDSITIYASLTKLDLSKFYPQSIKQNNMLFIFQNEIKIHTCDLQENYEISKAYRGNEAGYTYSPGLSNKDNIWIKDYEIEKLFDFRDYELCGMSLFGIKNNLSVLEKDNLRFEIDELLKEYRYPEFKSLLKSLLKKNIIMIGHCSC